MVNWRKIIFTVILISSMGILFPTYGDAAYGNIDVVKALEPIAKKGNTNAQLSLGEMYFNGYFTSQNYHKAVFWLEKAAKNGSIKAQLLTGRMLL